MYIDMLRQAYRDARMMEVIELLWVVLGVAACVSTAAVGIPGEFREIKIRFNTDSDIPLLGALQHRTEATSAGLLPQKSATNNTTRR